VTIDQKIDGASIVLLDIDGLVKAANGTAS
jgi:hypothetical protein